MTVLEIIDRYYAANAPLRALLLHHSEQVRNHAMRVVQAHPELSLDAELVRVGAMLHDVGICQCDAPGIHCHGTHHYIVHGEQGARMVRALLKEGVTEIEGVPVEAVARICERHTGTGLPGMEPQTLEEQVVCYADKFYSKSHPERERTPEQTAQSLLRFGEAGVAIFWQWHERFA